MPASSIPDPFRHVVCGVDASREGLEAARQSARLVAPNAQLTLVSVAVDSFFEPDAAEEALRRAWDEVHPVHEVESLLLGGSPPDVLLGVVDRTGATLVAVGIHQRSRTGAILAGGTAADVLSQAPCSVLVARPAMFPGRFPARIVAGVDGSPPSFIALEVARVLRARLGCDLTILSARGEKHAVEPLPGEHTTIEPGAAVPALVGAAQAADLVVVGARGLHGVRSLGSVSERVAFQADCSVLIVRSVMQPGN